MTIFKTFWVKYSFNKNAICSVKA